MTHVPQHNHFISFPWMEEIPDRLRSQLHWTHQAIPEDAPPRLVLLYTGKDDPGALDNMIHAMAPALSPYVLAYDNRRDGGMANQDLLAPNPYSYLCSLAYHGKVVLVGGGPNCRTWSILRWFPKKGAPVPVRGRGENTVWGLPGLQPSETLDVDSDSLLMLRLFYLTSLAKWGLGRRFPHIDLESFMEHPRDPAISSSWPNAHRCSSIWATRAYIRWAHSLGHRLLQVDQCRLGQVVTKPTSFSTTLPLDHWHDLYCNHGKHEVSGDLKSSDLSRYPAQLMQDLAADHRNSWEEHSPVPTGDATTAYKGTHPVVHPANRQNTPTSDTHSRVHQTHPGPE